MSSSTTPSTKRVAVKAALPAKKAVAAKKRAVVSKPAAKSPAKPAAAPQPTQAAKPSKPPKAVKVVKEPKLKIVRDSFTMPEADFALIEATKARALKWPLAVKKSEVLRAALHALQALSDDQAKALLTNLQPVKKGRPKLKA